MPNSKIIRTTPETQADSSWIPPAGTLGELVAASRQRALGLEKTSLRSSWPDAPSLRDALLADHVTVIAEIKRSSPSKGPINLRLESSEQARAYEAGGAAAVSVLTEPERFGGRNEDIESARAVSSLPVLRKDFHVTESQLEEARALGASGALVIVRAVEPSRLKDLAIAAREISLEILFEVRNESELDIALDAGAILIGVNNRDLETLEVDPLTVQRIVPLIPPRCVAIAESGYSTRSDVERAGLAGADAVLVGSSLSASGDPSAAVRRLTGVAKSRRKG